MTDDFPYDDVAYYHDKADNKVSVWLRVAAWITPCSAESTYRLWPQPEPCGGIAANLCPLSWGDLHHGQMAPDL